LSKILNVQHKICCGIDVHKKTVVACVLKTDEYGEYIDSIKTFSTMTSDLENLRDWLIKENCEKVAMESTGVYWIPVFNILADVPPPRQEETAPKLICGAVLRLYDNITE